MRWGLQLRRIWGQLTSMRTALVLLFLLALAAIPGATFPQRNLNPEKVIQYFEEHPDLAPVLDRLWGFDVFASPWFAAIYLLLFTSLTGCLLSRIRVHLMPLFTGPPPAPRYLNKLPSYAGNLNHTTAPAETAKVVRAELKRLGWRRATVRASGDTVSLSSERGAIHEVGNLVFHLSLLVVLIGVAIGSLWGWKGGALIVEESQFCNTVQSYDQFSPGRFVKGESIAPFCMSMSDFKASYLRNGQPVNYQADVRYIDGAKAGEREPDKDYRIRVNHPLRLNGAGVFLINHGYAPILRYKDRYGTVFESPTPFLPTDNSMTSEGVAVFPDANQDPTADPDAKKKTDVQVAFEGIYLPTAPAEAPFVRSTFPKRHDEGITLLAYRGDTGLDAGSPRSVYSLDQNQVTNGKLKPLESKFLRKGESWTLDDGSEVTFVGTKEWASMEISHDPGRLVALGGAVAMVAGLLVSLFTRRRRVFIRMTPNDGGTTVELAGLARADSPAFRAEFERIVAAMCDANGRRDNEEKDDHAGK